MCLGAAHAPLALTNPASEVVHALKYGGRRGAARFMAQMMVRGARGGWLPPPDAILVPIPTTPERERGRGYNQARELARELGNLLKLPSLDLLDRIGSQESQIALHPDQRRANVSGVFHLGSKAGPPSFPAPLILVDDVLTTGATAGAAAEVLQTVGSGSVELWAFARTLPDVHALGA